MIFGIYRVVVVLRTSSVSNKCGSLFCVFHEWSTLSSNFLYIVLDSTPESRRGVILLPPFLLNILIRARLACIQFAVSLWYA